MKAIAARTKPKPKRELRRNSLLGFGDFHKENRGNFNSNSHYKNWFCDSQPKAGCHKTNFGVFSAEGAENPKIGFIMRIAEILIKVLQK
ncbi:hypothetical protein HCU40_15670 [Pseudanabaena biceps]|nr:hypothetical protein [Pseudanabaena biceps]